MIYWRLGHDHKEFGVGAHNLKHIKTTEFLHLTEMKMTSI